jgi:hypothetical protein
MKTLLLLIAAGYLSAQTPLPSPTNGAGGSGGTGCVPSGAAGIVQASTGSGACQSTAIKDTGTVIQITEPLNLTTVLAILYGGTGTATPGLVAGSNVTITGSWPNQTINSSGGGGGNPVGSAGVYQIYATSTTFGAGSLTDIAGVVSTTEPFSALSVSTGTSPPSAPTGGTAGGSVMALGTNPSANCVVAGVACMVASSASNLLLLSLNGAPLTPLVQGPTTSVANHVATWSGTLGNILLDGGVLGTAAAVSSTCSADLTGTLPACTVAKVNGIAYSATAAAHSVEVITTANTTATAKVLPDCTDATGNHLNYTQSTDLFSCGNTSSGGTPSFPVTVAGAVTSGGIPYFSSTTVETSSALLTQYGVVFGGGAGGAPTVSAQGAANMPLIGQGAANPIFSTIAYPNSATSGGIPYFSSATGMSSSAALTVNVLPKGGGAGAAPTNSSITDNGTTVATAETLSLGTSPPACTAGTAGGVCYTEGTAITNVAGAGALDANSTTHELEYQSNGSALKGMIVRAQPGSIKSTGLVAAVTTATLCASSAGACNTAGTYHVHVALYQSGTACTSNTTGGVTPSLTWTDGNGTAHSAQGIPMDTNASLTALSGTMLWNASTLGAWGSGDVNIDSNGSIIQYAIAFAQCSVSGTATYAADLVVTRIQ